MTRYDFVPVKRFGPAHWTVIIAIWLTVLGILYSQSGKYVQYPLDAYYYLEMAKNFADSGRPIIRFEQGYPNKFFPGYPMLLGAASLLSEPIDTWIWLQLVLYIATSGLWLRFLFRLNLPAYLVLGAAALFSSNYILLKWGGLPHAEGAAVFWTVLAANVAISGLKFVKRCSLCGLVLGIATLTRPDAVVCPLFFAAVLSSEAGKAKGRFLGVVILLLVAAAPVALYLVLKKTYGGETLPYVREFVQQSEHIKFDMFVVSIMKMFRQPNLLHDIQFVNITVILTHWLYIVALVVGFRGILGRKAAWSSVGVILYLAAHTFWYYPTERFNLLVLAPSVYLVCCTIAWYIFQDQQPPGLKVVLYYGVIGLLIGSQLIYGYTAIREHRMNLSVNVGKPRLLAELANNKPGIAWSEIGPEFAHFFQGNTYIDNDQTYFFQRTSTPGEFFAKHNVNWIVSKLSVDGWFTAHPAVSSATLSLKRHGSDGSYSLYEVSKK